MIRRRPAAPRHRRRPRGRVATLVALVALATAVPFAKPPAVAAEARVPGTSTWLLSYETGDRFCLAHAFFPTSGIGLGFVSDGEALGVGLVNADWTLRAWGDYDIDFRFDGSSGTTARFVATDATAMATELDAAAEADFRGADFVELIAAGGRVLGRLSLKGSARAIDYVRACGTIAGGDASDADAEPRGDGGARYD